MDTFDINAENPLIVAIDCQRKSNWRTKFYDEFSKPFEEYQGKTYKGQRKKDPTIPWDTVHNILNDVKFFLRQSTDVLVIEHPKCEADDVIFCLTKREGKYTIISSDKDFKQLLSDRIRIYDPIKKEYLELDRSPEDFLKLHILMGDKSDNIMACKPRMGEKTALKHLESLDSWLELEDEMRSRYNFNKVLIDLREIPENLIEDLDEIIDLELENNHKNFNFNDTLTFFRKYKLRKLSERIDQLHFL